MGSGQNTAFQALIAALPPAVAGGLCVTERCDIALVSVMTKPGAEEAAAPALARLSDVVAVGPGHWLGAGYEGLAEVADRAGVAVFDQRAAFGILELVGDQARQVLQKGVFVDLGEQLPVDGTSLCGVIARVNVVLWRHGVDRFMIAVPRSFAATFWHWLQVSSAAEIVRLGR